MMPEKIRTSFNSFLESRIVPLNNRNKWLIAGAAWAVPVIAFFFLFVSPETKKIHGLESKKAKLTREIKKVAAVARELGRHKAEKAEVEKKFKEASLFLPEKKEIPSLLTNISSQGTNSGLDFLSFKPKTERLKEFYAEIPVDIVVRGPYHNVEVFLDKISKLPRIVSVSDISMGAPALKDGEMMLNTKFSLVTYRFIEAGDVKEKPKKKKKKKRRR